MGALSLTKAIDPSSSLAPTGHCTVHDHTQPSMQEMISRGKNTSKEMKMSGEDKMGFGSPSTSAIDADETIRGGKLTPAAPDSEPDPSVASAPASGVQSCANALNDSNFKFLYDKSAPDGTAAFATCIAPTLPAYTPSPAVVPGEPAPTKTVAAALAPPLEVAPAHPLDDGNFLLLAEFAHVVQDILALRGTQVPSIQSIFFQSQHLKGRMDCLSLNK